MTVIGNPATMGKMGIPIYLTVTVTTGAVVTATNGSKTVNGTSASGSCTLKLPEAGTWTVSATLNNTSSNTKTITVEDTYAVTLLFVSTTLNNNEWSTIKKVSDAGEGVNYWAIGDSKAITLNGTTVGDWTFSNETYYAFIIGFDHNSTYEGTNRIHFQFGKTALTGGYDICFVDGSYNSTGSSPAFRMNISNNNTGGWSSSYMRNNICGTSLSSYSGTFIGALPSDLRAVLKSVTKYTDNAGNGSKEVANVTATTDYIFLLAEYEIFGSISYANSNESAKQVQYAYYSAGNSKIKYKASVWATANTLVAANWWVRSPNKDSSNGFVYIASNGNGNITSAYYSIGLAPGFCV